MSIFKKKTKGGMADVIRCDEKNYLIWKWHPSLYEEGTLKRENAIRTNSVLRVKNGEVAVFVYKQKDGSNEDYIVGPYDDTLKTKNFPVLTKVIGLWYEGETPFQAEVFFINLAEVVQVKFGVPYFDVVDPRYPDFQVPVAVRGIFTFRISDYKAFVKSHQLATFDLNQFKSQIIDLISRCVKEAVTDALAKSKISVISIESQIGLINEKAESNIKERLNNGFGIEVVGIDVGAIEIDKDSDAYRELRKITKDIVMKESEINVDHYEKTLAIQREESQFAQHMATKQANIGAYEAEIKGQVGVESAKALGKMGENGVGSINLGSSNQDGAGFNPVSLMAGLTMGGVVAKNIGGTLESALNTNSAVPPAVPQTAYYIVVDGKSVGPFDGSKIQSMIASGQIERDSLIWKQGMTNWEKIKTLSEFSSFFPPDLPGASQH